MSTTTPQPTTPQATPPQPIPPQPTPRRHRSRPSRRRRPVYLGLGAVLAIVTSMFCHSTSAEAAAPAFGLVSLTASVSATSVTASAKVSANPQTVANRYGVCARTAAGKNVDFPKLSNVTIKSVGTSVSPTKTFSAGVYRYFACVKISNKWYNVGSVKSFTVGATGGSAALPGASPAGWTRVFTEDFNTPAKLGQWPGSYSSKWTDYEGIEDTYGVVKVAPSKVVTVHDGTLDMYLHSENGQPYGAAPQPLISGGFAGQLYGRYAVRFKTDSLPHFGTAWLLWPDSNNWNQGEIDFPEGGLGGVMNAYTHCIGDHPEKNCYAVKTDVPFSSGWHTAVIEWTRGKVTYLIDGAVVGTSGSSPTVPMHWVLQTISTGTKPAVSTQGHLLIDWVTIDKPS